MHSMMLQDKDSSNRLSLYNAMYNAAHIIESSFSTAPLSDSDSATQAPRGTNLRLQIKCTMINAQNSNRECVLPSLQSQREQHQLVSQDAATTAGISFSSRDASWR